MRMVATSMEELEMMLCAVMQEAMNLASSNIYDTMKTEVESFYKGNKPVEYERTGALSETPRIKFVGRFDKSVTFLAYLDSSHQYSTGSLPSMKEVLLLADRGIPFNTRNGYPARPTVGRKGFWEKAENKMERELSLALGKYFRKG